MQVQALIIRLVDIERVFRNSIHYGTVSANSFSFNIRFYTLLREFCDQLENYLI